MLLSASMQAQNCLVASYPFCQNAHDRSGNGHHGTVVGAQLTNSHNGILNNAYEFNGFSDYITVPHDTSFDFDFNDDFTIAFWIKLPVSQANTANNTNDIIDKWNGSAGTYKFPYSIRVYNQTSSGRNGILRFTRRDIAACDNYMEANPDTNLNDTTFHHLALVKENDTLYMYIDGTGLDTIPDSSACNTANGHDLTFAKRSGTSSPNFMKGVLDDINIYRCPLDLSQIQALYHTEYFVDSASICDGDSLLIGGVYRDTTGEFLTHYTNSFGHDSIVCFHLKVLPNSYSMDTREICHGDSVYLGGGFQKTAGVYVDAYSGKNGCDSIVQTALSVFMVNTSVFLSGNQLIAGVNGAKYQWIDCNNNNISLFGDTNALFSPQVSGTYAVAIVENGCADTSDCYNITFFGIEENGENSISIAPNPTGGNLTVRWERQQDVRIQIIDPKGSMVFERTYTGLDETRIALDQSLNPGIYTIRLIGNDQSVVSRSFVLETD